jgi:hypothetical protein
MKRVVLALAGVVSILVFALAVDKFILHPQRQAIKILRYYASADARRIHELEQLVAAPRLNAQPLARQIAAETCVKSTVSAVHADYDAIPRQFERCRDVLAAYLSAWAPNAPEDFLFAAYAAALASQLGSYGPSNETDVRVIAKGGVLNCTQTTIFVAATIKTFRPSVSVTEIALESASIGEHGLVEVGIVGQKFVMDGATGAIFLASMNKMLEPGRKYLAMINFFEEEDKRLSSLLEEMIRSTQLGHFSADDIISRRAL